MSVVDEGLVLRGESMPGVVCGVSVRRRRRRHRG